MPHTCQISKMPVPSSGLCKGNSHSQAPACLVSSTILLLFPYFTLYILHFPSHTPLSLFSTSWFGIMTLYVHLCHIMFPSLLWSLWTLLTFLSHLFQLFPHSLIFVYITYQLLFDILPNLCIVLLFGTVWLQPVQTLAWMLLEILSWSLRFPVHDR